MPFSQYMEAALYGSGGFYAAGGGAGRRADFITSPEIGPLFGAVMARAIDQEWVRCGRPDPWVVIEAGAGRGTLATAVLAAAPACSQALRYVAVEVSSALRALAGDLLTLEEPALVLGPVSARRVSARGGGGAVGGGGGGAGGPGGVGGGGHPVDGGDDWDDGDDGSGGGSGDRRRASGHGPLVTVLGSLPAGPVTGMVIANELLDNLPFDLLQRCGTGFGGDVGPSPDAGAAPGGSAGLAGGAVGGAGIGQLKGLSANRGWCEVRVGEAGGQAVEVLVPASSDDEAEAESLAPEAEDGARIPLQRVARAWLRQALSLLDVGRVICIDYADTTPSLAQRPQDQWLRTYRGHGRGGLPLEGPGTQDVTCEVAVDQLDSVRPFASMRSQADWLRANGLGPLVDDARRQWDVSVGRPTLSALKARSRVSEAAAITDPSGLGGFTILEWVVGGSSISAAPKASFRGR